MNRYAASFAALTLFVFSSTAMAQGFHRDRHNHRDNWHHDFHRVNVHRLDSYADRLAEYAEHLHDDAHQLSQDYHHSAAIEAYVVRLERLQHHMHEILHDAARTGRQSTAMVRHLQSDVATSRTLLKRLYGELQHQGIDGARSRDYQLMAHMRRIIANSAYPLLNQMNNELSGYSVHRTNRVRTDRVRTLRWPTHQDNWTRPRVKTGYRF